MESKDALRRLMKNIRRNLSDGEVGARSSSIMRQVLELPEVIDAKALFCYQSRNHEARTDALIAKLRQAGKTVVVPEVIGDGVMKTSEPIEVQVCITPGLAFDEEGGRVGFGGGYYDRWLHEHPEVVTIALAYDEQVVESVPMTEHDVPIDIIVTPNMVYRVS